MSAEKSDTPGNTPEQSSTGPSRDASLSRRSFLKATSFTSAAVFGVPFLSSTTASAAPDDERPPIRKQTENPPTVAGLEIHPLEKRKINGINVDLKEPPAGLHNRSDLGVVMSGPISARRVHAWPRPLHFCPGPRGVKTPGGDLMALFPAGRGHYHSAKKKVNDLVAYRSTDGGDTWNGPELPWRIPYNQHGSIPFIPSGSNRLYSFATEPRPDVFDGVENAAIGFRHSDDDGRTWSDVNMIRPENDKAFKGMSLMRMTETENGTWLVGSHTADWSGDPVETRQYLLRSEDQGSSWELLPGPRPEGWQLDQFKRLDEGRPIALGGGHVMLMVRTVEGHLWQLRSEDDGKTWTNPEPTELVHPDAPPMVFFLSDGKTLAAFHHNRHHGKHFNRKDRSELWVALSDDGGRSWSEPRFVVANTAKPSERYGEQYRVSYCDLVLDEGWLHLFVDHQTRQVLHLRFKESNLNKLPTKAELKG